MKTLKMARQNRELSQRGLAKLAKLSYKSLQLLEAKGHDPKISTLQSIAGAFGYPPQAVLRCIENLFATPADSIAIISERIAVAGEVSWKLWLFNFVDAFRSQKDARYVEAFPVKETPTKIKALLASTVEALCAEFSLKIPEWCEGIPPLENPWFVSGVENLKAFALMESPVWFRKRNIFVLKNFLERR